jgi:hypothetical protein
MRERRARRWQNKKARIATAPAAKKATKGVAKAPTAKVKGKGPAKSSK